jgi:hypothetical protein
MVYMIFIIQGKVVFLVGVGLCYPSPEKNTSLNSVYGKLDSVHPYEMKFVSEMYM